MNTSDENNAPVALVTGAGSGIGRHIALALDRAGYVVYASMRDPQGRNGDKAWSLKAAASEYLSVIELDVTNDNSVQLCMQALQMRSGHIDVLVNNAGIMHQGVTEAYTLDDIRLQMETNFFGTARTNRAVLPLMRERRSGLLIHITSIAGSIVFPYAGLYSASKMATEAMAESYRYELEPFGIDSIVVQPCPYQSDLLDSQKTPGDEECLRAYGDYARIAEERIASTKSWHDSGKAHDAAEVGDLIVSLAALPFGQRPFRTVAGAMDMGSRKLNLLKQEMQEKLMRHFGVGQRKDA
ncbi:SDR family oxidoreductase [Herminiimonas arsenitoxidans]|uniref:SDR family oxidoreductase n=1 Tax=Herminiimonas arsenitoxidans TaxID=1809410 RepID=UPI000970EFB3|nr:SDR family oxidoreductase [Herminiimonas arsenitoxidans]